MIAFLIAFAAAVATPAPTSQCATVSPVTSSTDIIGLQKDADCFGAAAAADRAARDVLSKAITAATASQKYRLDRIAQLKACPDGTVILKTATCPAPLPPPPATQTCPDGSVILATDTCPPVVVTPPPTPAPGPSPLGGWVLASSVTPIEADGVDVNLGRVASGLPGSNAPDVVGAERFICGPGPLVWDDPIVYPGQPGKSHLHQLYGNTGVNAYSDYQSLRTSGDSTCSGPHNPLNRSGYWVPAMLDGKGNAIRPDYETLYYKQYPDPHLACHDIRFSKGCIPIQDSLRMIIGADMSKAPAPYTKATFECSASNGGGQLRADATGKTVFDTMEKALAVCPNDGKWSLTLGLSFPECVDGVHIDSPDHRSHLGYATSDPRAGPGGLACPVFASTGERGYFQPTLRLFWSYSILPGDDTSKWHLSCTMGLEATLGAGWCIHADYWMAWRPSTNKEWHDNCINKLIPTSKYGSLVIPGFPAGMGPVSGTGGNLCDGFRLTGASAPAQGFGVTTPNRVVPLASIPQTPVKP